MEKKRADATVTAVQGLQLLWPSLNDQEFLDGTRHVIYLAQVNRKSKIENLKSND